MKIYSNHITGRHYFCHPELTGMVCVLVCVCPCVCDDASAQWRNGVSVLCKKSDTTQLRHHNVVAILVGKRGVIGVKKTKGKY